MSARARERGDRVEWRLVCNNFPDDRHKLHAWMMSAKSSKTETLRAELLASRSLDGYPGCHPFRVECRYVSDWTTDIDRIEGLAQ